MTSTTTTDHHDHEPERARHVLIINGTFDLTPVKIAFEYCDWKYYLRRTFETILPQYMRFFNLVNQAETVKYLFNAPTCHFYPFPPLAAVSDALQWAHWGSRITIDPIRRIITAQAPTEEDEGTRLAAAQATMAATSAPEGHLRVMPVNITAGSPNRSEIHYDYPSLVESAPIDWEEFERRFGDTDFLIVHGPITDELIDPPIPGDRYCLTHARVATIRAHLPHLRWCNIRDHIRIYNLDSLPFTIAMRADHPDELDESDESDDSDDSDDPDDL